MIDHLFILSFVAVPALGFLLSLLFKPDSETAIARTAFWTSALQLVLVLGFIPVWIAEGAPVLNIREVTLYASAGYEFFIDFYFDRTTAVFLFVGAFVTFLITRYSRFYMHLEDGYKRFFNTVLLFFLAYNFTVLSGNFETLFLGWELLGISSFLLIAFYRSRYLPSRNAVKVFSVYRIGDVGILLAVWASHHLFHENITFQKLADSAFTAPILEAHSWTGLLIAVSLLVAAAAKSAQFPFSTWLPRAMEGPTPSSAIFYGGLSVHFGVFLMLRTYPFWEHQEAARWLIGLTGATTAAAGFFITRVQTTVKTQIAYASITQIGLMFIEAAAGLHALVLLHFAGNAFLRTYQLLVSPSVVAYTMRDQLYHYEPAERYKLTGLIGKLDRTLYVAALKEFGLEQLVNRLAFVPFRKVGHRLDFITLRNAIAVVLPMLAVTLALFWNRSLIPGFAARFTAEAIAVVGFLLVLKAFSERHSPYLSWLLVAFNHAWIVLAVSFNEQFDTSHVLIYLSGIIPAALAGWFLLRRLERLEPGFFDMTRYYGHVYRHPRLAFGFLLCCLGAMGFPVSPSFVGEDLIFSHIHESQFVLAFFYAQSYVLSGIVLIRIYAHLYLGTHIHTNHGTPLRAS